MTAREHESMHSAASTRVRSRMRDAAPPRIIDSACAALAARPSLASVARRAITASLFGPNPAVASANDVSEVELRRTLGRTAGATRAATDMLHEMRRAPRETRTPTIHDAAPLRADDRHSPCTSHRSIPFATARRIAATRGRTLAAHPIGAR